MARPRRQSRRGFGKVRQLPSGRFQASYLDPGDGITRRTAPATFTRRGDGDAWLAGIRADITRGAWRSPDAGNITLTSYLNGWLESRTDLAPGTVNLYRDLDRRWISANVAGVSIGAVQLRGITPALVRRWHAGVAAAATASAGTRLANAGSIPDGTAAREWAKAEGVAVKATGRIPATVMAAWEAAGSPVPERPVNRCAAPGSTVAAQAYRLLHATLAQAVADELITSSPVNIKRAGQTTPAERVPATPAEVQVIAANMPDRYRAAVLVAAWSGLRAGELFGLARRHVDLDSGMITVERSVSGDGKTFGATKTRASRNVYLPATITADLAGHMEKYTGPQPDALIFGTGSGTPLRSANRSAMFIRARREAGRDDLHWHDLRHTGAIFATQAGATLTEVQARLGHATPRAALIYQHAVEQRDRLIAERLDEHARSTGVIPLRRRARP